VIVVQGRCAEKFRVQRAGSLTGSRLRVQGSGFDFMVVEATAGGANPRSQLPRRTG
jgi:hypothetical protein